jgi:hypothetical protein
MRELRLVGIVLAIFILILILTYFTREGFTNADSEHSAFAEKYRQKYNEVGAALTVSGASPPTKSNIGALGSNTQGMFGSVTDSTDSNGNTKQVIDNPYPLESRESGIIHLIKKCEAVNTADCDAFDNPSFTTDCGICLDIGKNSQGKAATGGLLLLTPDKEYAQENQVGNFLAPYRPTVGSCPAKRMVATKAECLRVKAEIKCQKNTTFDSPTGCSQCYSDTSYSIIDSANNKEVLAGSGTLSIIGSGTLKYSEAGQQNTGAKELSDRPIQITLLGPELNNINLQLIAPSIAKNYDPSITYSLNDLIIFNGSVYKLTEEAGFPGYEPSRENDKLWKFVSAATDFTIPPAAYIAGYLSGATANGEFQIDLYRLILNDSNTGRKPRTSGEVDIGGVSVSKMSPGYGFKGLTLVARSPFTFVDPLSQEASMCPTSPFITKQASSEFLGSDPCYKKGSGPGKYSVECLQNTFIANGCTQNGKAYPTTAANSAALLVNSAGKPQTIDDIANKVYANAVLTATGVDINGNQASTNDWSKASIFCTGVVIDSPCDTANQTTGPLTSDCIIYLWNNRGENKRVGTTYNNTSLANSLFKSGNTPRRFCTVSGSLSPINSNGTRLVSNTSYWQGLGGLAAVTKAMKKLHADANSNMISDSAKKLAMQQCYGINLNSRPQYSTQFVSDTGVNPNTEIQVGPDRSMTPTLVPGALGNNVNINAGNTIGGTKFNNGWHSMVYGTMPFDFTNWRMAATINVKSYGSENFQFFNPSNNPTGTGIAGGEAVGTFVNGDFSTLCFMLTAGKLVIAINNAGSPPSSQYKLVSQNQLPTGKDIFIDARFSSGTLTVNIVTSNVNETITQSNIKFYNYRQYTTPEFKEITGTQTSQIWAAGQGNRFHADCIVKYLYVSPGAPIQTNIVKGATLGSPFYTHGPAGKGYNYSLSFYITPTGITKNWGSILRISYMPHDGSPPNDMGQGSRNPAIFFVHGTTKAYIRIGDTRNNDWGVQFNQELPLNVKSRISIVCNDKDVQITAGNETMNIQQPNSRWLGGPFQIFCCDSFYEPAIGIIEGISFVVDGVQQNIPSPPLPVSNSPSSSASSASSSSGFNSGCFNAACYASRYGDLMNAFGPGLTASSANNLQQHWIQYGMNEKRNPCCDSKRTGAGWSI